MYDQPRYEPLEASYLLLERHVGPAARGRVPSAVGEHATPTRHLYDRARSTASLATTFPFEITRKDLVRGQERFMIYCSPCHGATGNGRGMIVQRGFPPPPPFYGKLPTADTEPGRGRLQRPARGPRRPLLRRHHQRPRCHVLVQVAGRASRTAGGSPPTSGRCSSASTRPSTDLKAIETTRTPRSRLSSWRRADERRNRVGPRRRFDRARSIGLIVGGRGAAGLPGPRVPVPGDLAAPLPGRPSSSGSASAVGCLALIDAELTWSTAPGARSSGARSKPDR